MLRRDAIIYQNIEKKGKEKMANKGWIVTIFAFKSENMALNRFLFWTTCSFPPSKNVWDSSFDHDNIVMNALESS